MLKPFSDYLVANNITPIIESYTDAPSYVEHAKNFGVSAPMKDWTSGGRMIPQAVLQSPTRRAELVTALKKIVAAGCSTSSTSVRPVDRIGNPTSLHPAWRDMAGLQIITFPWENNNADAMRAKVLTVSNELAPLLIQVAPDSASYSNEADPFLKDWQREIYGPQWDRLLGIKEKYDPGGVFYSLHTPGADKWVMDENWRMCKA